MEPQSQAIDYSVIDMDTLEHSVEAVIFASGEPIEISKISEALCVEASVVIEVAERLNESYKERGSALEIVQLGKAYQMCTKGEYAESIRRALELKKNTPLSNSMLEVLAIVAYNQPVTRAFVEQIRGVDCTYSMKSLSDKGLIEEAGRLNIPGRPLGYRTTAGFLRIFGLSGIENLPDISEFHARADEGEAAEDLIDSMADEASEL